MSPVSPALPTPREQAGCCSALRAAMSSRISGAWRLAVGDCLTAYPDGSRSDACSRDSRTRRRRSGPIDSVSPSCQPGSRHLNTTARPRLCRSPSTTPAGSTRILATRSQASLQSGRTSERRRLCTDSSGSGEASKTRQAPRLLFLARYLSGASLRVRRLSQYPALLIPVALIHFHIRRLNSSHTPG